MPRVVKGGCLCGAVKFQCEDEFARFYQCHCKQCRQLTGSAYAANLFTEVDNIEWLHGATQIKKFQHPSRDFSKAFCGKCGSALPFVTKSGKALLVPAGSLDDHPSIPVSANIFMSERVSWLQQDDQLESFDEFPH